MDAASESSSNPKNEVEEKPVIVRVKRKVGQSLLDAFWLEINESPLKRPTLDLSKLSISNSGSSVVEDVKPKKVLVQHLETVTDSKTTVDIIHSFFESDLNEKSCSRGNFEERRIAFKKDNRKEQLLNKAVQQQQRLLGFSKYGGVGRETRKAFLIGVISLMLFVLILKKDETMH